MIDKCPTCEGRIRETIGMICPTCHKDYAGVTMQYDNNTSQWVEAVPLGPVGIVARVEVWLRDRGWSRLAHILGRFDERGL